MTALDLPSLLNLIQSCLKLGLACHTEASTRHEADPAAFLGRLVVRPTIADGALHHVLSSRFGHLNTAEDLDLDLAFLPAALASPFKKPRLNTCAWSSGSGLHSFEQKTTHHADLLVLARTSQRGDGREE